MLGTLRTLLRESDNHTWVVWIQLGPSTVVCARISHTRSYHHVWFLLDLTGREFRGNSPAFISCAHTRHRHFVTWTRTQNLPSVWQKIELTINKNNTTLPKIHSVCSSTDKNMYEGFQSVWANNEFPERVNVPRPCPWRSPSLPVVQRDGGKWRGLTSTCQMSLHTGDSNVENVLFLILLWGCSFLPTSQQTREDTGWENYKNVMECVLINQIAKRNNVTTQLWKAR